MDRLRRFAVAVSFLARAGLFGLACTPSPSSGSSHSDDAAVAPAEQNPRTPESVENGADMNIGGTVINDDGEVVVGRPLVALDARGTRFEEMTDEGGGFWLMHAEPPYDLALDPSPSGLSPVPVVFLGLSRTDPRLEVSEHFEEPPPPAPRTLPTPPAPPRPVTPAQGGTLAASSAGIVWESEGAHVTIVTVTNAHGERLFRVFTEQNDVPFAKLEALGIPRLSLGTYTLELETSSASTLEAWTDPDAPRSDLGANDGTLVRFSFEVVAS